MPNALGSIPPLAPSHPPPAVLMRPVRAGSGRAAGARASQAPRPIARSSRAPTLSLVPPPVAAAVSAPERRPNASQSLSIAPPAPLTAIAFRPDGRPALTLRLGFSHGVAALLAIACTVCLALATGWLIGEWTALL
jgi:hypothetical protein